MRVLNRNLGGNQRLFDRNADHAGSRHAERTRRAQRHIDNPAPDEWSAIIDAALYGMTGVRHRDDASERPGAMRTGHLAPVTASAIVGGKTAFSFGCGGDGKQRGGKESTSIHGKNLTKQRRCNQRYEVGPSVRGIRETPGGGRNSHQRAGR
jgi:hypothetical protein